jgi:hypothetical protein
MPQLLHPPLEQPPSEQLLPQPPEQLLQAGAAHDEHVEHAGAA